MRRVYRAAIASAAIKRGENLAATAAAGRQRARTAEL
jgi:hypothetical protein